MNGTPPFSVQKSSPLVILVVWSIVALPLGWGLYQSLIKSKPLFAGERHDAPVRPLPAAPTPP
jgi:hypothetical protein